MPAASASKAQFIADLQTAINALVPSKLSWTDIVNNYFKNGFNVGGSNAIVAGDLTGTGLTPTQVGNGITMMQQLANFFGNVAVAQGDYEATLQTIKTL